MVQPSPLVLEHFHHPSKKKSHVHCLLPSSPCYASVLFIIFILLNVLIKLSNSFGSRTSTSNIWLTCSRSSCVCHSPQVISSKSSMFILLDPGIFSTVQLLFFERDSDPFRRKHTHIGVNKTQVCLFKMNFLRWLHF